MTRCHPCTAYDEAAPLLLECRMAVHSPDSGTAFSMVPPKTLERFGVTPKLTTHQSLADGQAIDHRVGFALFRRAHSRLQHMLSSTGGPGQQKDPLDIIVRYARGYPHFIQSVLDGPFLAAGDRTLQCSATSS